MKKLLLISTILSVLAFSAKTEKPFRIDLKLGFPSMAGLGFECVLPTKTEKIKFAIVPEYSIMYFGYGILVQHFGLFPKIYFKPEAKGFFVGPAYGLFFSRWNDEKNSFPLDGFDYVGAIKQKKTLIGLIQLRAGYRWLKRKRYSFSMDFGITFVQYYFIKEKVTYNEEIIVPETKESMKDLGDVDGIPKILPVLNFNFGVAF